MNSTFTTENTLIFGSVPRNGTPPRLLSRKSETGYDQGLSARESGAANGETPWDEATPDIRASCLKSRKP